MHRSPCDVTAVHKSFPSLSNQIYRDEHRTKLVPFKCDVHKLFHTWKEEEESLQKHFLLLDIEFHARRIYSNETIQSLDQLTSFKHVS
jgi:hypothetical protein